MRKILCALLCLALVLLLCACPLQKKGGVVFFYPYADMQYGLEQGVVGSEHRDVTGHENELSFLITLYLAGPLDEDLANPFPARTQLLKIDRGENSISISLAIPDKQFSDSRFTLACSTLARTCLALPGVEEVSVFSGERSITINRDNITVFDSVENYADNTEETQ